MRHLRLLSLSAVFAVSANPVFAGPCGHQIDLMQARFDAKLATAARKGPTATESVAATDHRQPTPDSIAAAEEKLGDVPASIVQAAEHGLARAREADLAGNETTCTAALAEVERAIGP
jgi:hypothetical protein